MGCVVSTKWPPILPVEKIPMMSEDEVVLVQVAWKLLEKQGHNQHVIHRSFSKLFTSHLSALKVFIRERRKTTMGSARSSVTFIHKGPHQHRRMLHDLSPLSLGSAVSNEGSEGSGARHTGSSLITASISSGMSGGRYYEWLPDCMFQMRQYDDDMGSNPEKDFLENGDCHWLGHHFKRMAMVMHHIVYVMHEPHRAQKWLSALRIGHSMIHGITTQHYQDLMVIMEDEIFVALGEKFYTKKIKRAMRKFLTVLFGYLAGHGLTFESSNSGLSPESTTISELENDILLGV